MAKFRRFVKREREPEPNNSDFKKPDSNKPEIIEFDSKKLELNKTELDSADWAQCPKGFCTCAQPPSGIWKILLFGF